MENKITKLFTVISLLSVRMLSFKKVYFRLYRRHTVVTELVTFLVALAFLYFFAKVGAYAILFAALKKTGDVSMLPKFSEFHFLIN